MVDILRGQIPFNEAPPSREPVSIDRKIGESARLLSSYVRDQDV